MSRVSTPPAVDQHGRAIVRHGHTSLSIKINGRAYDLRRKHSKSYSHLFILRKEEGERAGSVYSVSRSHCVNECNCHDFTVNKAQCKHINALIAHGLLPARKRRPSESAAQTKAIDQKQINNLIAHGLIPAPPAPPEYRPALAATQPIGGAL